MQEQENDEDDFGTVSTSIRDDLECALSGNLNFQGSFYFSRTYSSTEAPNPTLCLNKIGHVGLPLSQPEAKRVIRECRQAPFGQGERTIVDPTVRDTWEMDASQVSFDNPDWLQFLAKVVNEVCVALGVDPQLSRPRCEPYKLLLYETGSHFLPHQDTEKADGMFASLIIVLPSQFQGGAAHLKHGGMSKIIDASIGSLHRTTVMAWYTDVTHEIKPITSGYRLALSYNLIHTTNALRHSRPHHGVLGNLNHIFWSWSRTVFSAPKKIVYLLDHKYSQAGLSGQALKGSDAHKVALLEDVAKQYGFSLGLATVECHLSGHGDDWGDDSDPYAEFEEYKPMEMIEMGSRTMTLTRLVDLDGEVLTDEVELDDDEGVEDGGETIPDDLRETVEAGRIDEEDYEGYQGNYGGTLDRWYRRTALVIWPDLREEELLEGDDDVLTNALRILDSSYQAKPDPQDRQAVEYVLEALEDGGLDVELEEAVPTICGTAMRWKDNGIWTRLFDACDVECTLEAFNVELVSECLERLDVKMVLSSLGDILEQETDSTTQLEYLEDLKMSFPQLPDDWLLEQRERVLSELGSIVTEDIEPVIKATREMGGLKTIKDTVIPAILKDTKPDQLVEVALAIYEEYKDARGKDAKTSAANVAGALLREAIKRVTFHPNIAYNLITACIKTTNLIHLPDVAAKAIKPSFRDHLVPLLRRLHHSTSLRSTPTAVHSLGKMYQTGLPLLIDALNKDEPQVDELDVVVQPVVLSGLPSLLEKTVIPAMRRFAYKTAFCTTFIRVVRHRTEQAAARTGITIPLEDAVRSLTAEMVRQLDFPKCTVSSLLSLVKILLEGQEMGAIADLFSRLLESATASTHFLDAVLMPCISDLAPVLSELGIEALTNPFAPFFKGVILGWVRLVLGPHPGNQNGNPLQGFSCPNQCQLCADIWAFLANEEQELVLPAVGALAAKHLDQQLQHHGGSSVVTWKIVTTVPRGFEVKKKVVARLNMTEWSAQRDKGLACIQSINQDEAKLKSLFGDPEYDELRGRMDLMALREELQHRSREDPRSNSDRAVKRRKKS